MTQRIVASATHIQAVLENLGYDITDQHFARTPERAAQVLLDFHANGAEDDVAKLLEVSFSDTHDSLVQVGPITYTSFCAHHMLPVTGKAWVGYLPDGKVCGLSKLARVTHHYAHQLTVQERVTQQIADALEKHLAPKGAMVVVEAAHGCMSLRGVQEPEAVTVTSAVRGVFLSESDARAEFLALMRRGN
jgi:GTP cyclohydrolase IA